MICEKLICPWSSPHTCGHVISPFIQSLFYIFQKCFKIYFINFYKVFNRLKRRYLTLWRRKWQPTPVFLSGKPHGQRSLVGYSRGVAKSRTQLMRLSTAQNSTTTILHFTLWLWMEFSDCNPDLVITNFLMLLIFFSATLVGKKCP